MTMKYCQHCRYSKYAEPFGLWCLLLNAKANKPCDAFSREPGSDDE